MSQTVSVGRIVHFVLAEGAIRPAIVVRALTPTCANLQVFTDGDGDDSLLRNNERASRGPGKSARCVIWRTSVTEDPTGNRLGSWHWPPRV